MENNGAAVEHNIGEHPAAQRNGTEPHASKGELDRRKERLDDEERANREKISELKGRSEALKERSEGSGTREADLDDRRRAFVEEWDVAERQSAEVRAESQRIDQWRLELATKQQASKEAYERLQSISDEHSSLLKELHEGSGTNPPHQADGRLRRELAQKGREVDARKIESEALAARLTAEIDDYNRTYDQFLVSLERHIAEQVSWRSTVTDWLWDRQRHNIDVNERNAEGKAIDFEFKLLQAERDIWLGEFQRWRDDVSKLLGSLEISESLRSELTSEMDKLVWQHDDDQLVGIQFELLCADLLKQIGYSVTHEGGHDDGGIDIRASEGALAGQSWICLVQCKYKGSTGVVGANEMSQFVGKLSVAGPYNRALFMTAGTFHEEALDIAESNQVVVWDGREMLRQLVEEGVGLEARLSTDGRDLRFITEYWEELARRGEEIREARRKPSRRKRSDV